MWFYIDYSSTCFPYSVFRTPRPPFPEVAVCVRSTDLRAPPRGSRDPPPAPPAAARRVAVGVARWARYTHRGETSDYKSGVLWVNFGVKSTKVHRVQDGHKTC